jgi:hypothetical protein
VERSPEAIARPDTPRLLDYDVDGLFLSFAVMLVALWVAGQFFWNFGSTIWILLPVAVIFGALAWVFGEDAS